jgi:tRNA A-37 threonylcarbamoyl transferase component Bud32
MNDSETRHIRLADTVRNLSKEILQRLQPANSVTAQPVVNVHLLSRTSMHAVAAVEMRQNGNATRFCAKSELAFYRGPQSLDTEEYILRDIAPKIWQANAKARCPRVLAFFPEQKLLLLELVDGKSLMDLLFGAGLSHANLPGLLALSGEWLARFHAITQGEQADPFEWLESWFAEEKAREVFHRCGVDEQHSALVKLLKQFHLDYPDFRRPLCRVHDEFTPLHVLVQKDTIYVIDFGRSRLGFGYEDIALFITFLDALLPWRAAAGSLRLSLAKQKNIFLESYRAHCQQMLDVPDDVVTRFAYLRAMAHHESSWEKVRHSLGAAAHAAVGRAWVRRRFAAMARRELAYMQQVVSAPPVWHLDYAPRTLV